MTENLTTDIINLNLDLNLDREEQELLDSIENDNWVSIPNVKSEIQKFQEIAKQQVMTQRLELQISKQDSKKMYDLADHLGLSVSNLAQDIIHKYLQGELVEKS
jgi:predicted DNA binding CopG/RHH family protein